MKPFSWQSLISIIAEANKQKHIEIFAGSIVEWRPGYSQRLEDAYRHADPVPHFTRSHGIAKFLA
jgi:hypothetical protein